MGGSHLIQMGNPLEKVLPPCLSTTSQDVIASVNMSACVLSRVRLFVTPWTVTHQAPLSMDSSRQEYRSRLPFPPPGNLLPTQGSNLCLLHCRQILYLCETGHVSPKDRKYFFPSGNHNVIINAHAGPLTDSLEKTLMLEKIEGRRRG